MASKLQQEKKKQKFVEDVEKEDALLNPTAGGDDGKTEEETLTDDDDDDVEEEEYCDYDGDKDENLPPYIPYYSSEEDRDTVEYKEYLPIIRESKGFTVPLRPEGISIAATGPVQVLNPECLEELSRSAFVWYKENKTRSAYFVKSNMASKSEPEKKKQKFDEEVENKDALLYPTRGGDDGKTVEGTPNDSDEDDVEEEQYSDSDGDKDETLPPYIPYYSSDEDRDTVEYKEYMRIIRESKGFTVPPRPEGIRIAATGLVQVLNPECLEELSRSALVWYKENKEEDTETYELLRVDRGNARPARGILYFITFVARAVGTNGHVTFQAKVLDGLGRIHEVGSCDIVPNGS